MFFLNGISVKITILARIENRQFQGTILFMVFDDLLGLDIRSTHRPIETP